MKMLIAKIAVFLFLVAGAAYADPVDDIIAEARDFCASFENGEFDAGEAVTEVDLDGDGVLDRIVDSAAFSCSSMASAYCGSGGCEIYPVIGDRSWSYQAVGWRMIDWDGRPVLLVARDGGWCGGAGAQVCYEAVAWSEGDTLSVMPPAPE